MHAVSTDIRTGTFSPSGRRYTVPVYQRAGIRRPSVFIHPGCPMPSIERIHDATNGLAPAPRFSVPLRGVEIDPHTRCIHHREPRDVIAIRPPCCNAYYPCDRCHEETAAHQMARWPRDQWSERAVLCGVCGRTMTIADYLRCGHECPWCTAVFNPRCGAHWDRYVILD